MNNKNNFFSLLEYDPIKLFNKMDKVKNLIDLRDGHRTFDPSSPISVEMHLTDICNLKCYWCTDKDLKSNKATLDYEVVKKLFKEFASNKVGVTLEGGGEPTLHPRFDDIVKCAGNNNLDIGLITNGTKDISHLAEHFKWIRVSLDSTNSKEYLYEKGVDCFDKVMTNLESLSMARDESQTLLGVGYVVTRHNSSNVIELVKRLDGMGVDYIYMRPVEESEDNLPDIDEMYKLRKYFDLHKGDMRIKVLLNIDERIIKNNAGFPCIAHSLTCVIRADGNLIMCEKRRHNMITLGNVNQSSFKDIWLSDKRKSISEELLCSTSTQGCDVCRLTKFNKLLYNLAELKTNNFI